jgi:hypothetical protein
MVLKAVAAVFAAASSAASLIFLTSAAGRFAQGSTNALSKFLLKSMVHLKRNLKKPMTCSAMVDHNSLSRSMTELVLRQFNLPDCLSKKRHQHETQMTRNDWMTQCLPD